MQYQRGSTSRIRSKLLLGCPAALILKSLTKLFRQFPVFVPPLHGLQRLQKEDPFPTATTTRWKKVFVFAVVVKEQE